MTLKKSRYTEEQIAFALKQAETGTPAAETLRRMGISEQGIVTLTGRSTWATLDVALRADQGRGSPLLHGRGSEPPQRFA